MAINPTSTADTPSNIEETVKQTLAKGEGEVTPTRFDEIRAVLARLADMRARGILPPKKPFTRMTPADFEKIYRHPKRPKDPFNLR